MDEKYDDGEYSYGDSPPRTEGNHGRESGGYDDKDVFGHEENHDVSF